MSIRNNLKFQPFAPISEQHSAFKRLVQETCKVPLKVLDEYEKEELGYKIEKAYLEKIKIRIIYYKDGHYKDMIGQIIKINKLEGLIVLKDKVEIKVPFEHINEIDLMDLLD